MQDKQLQLFNPDKPIYKSVSTAEKRKMLEEAGEPWPVCDCCGLQKVWNSCRNKSGGSWQLRCTVLRKMQRNVRTPGSYAYKKKHGIGRPGELAREAGRRQYDTPGTHKYHEKMMRTRESMQKYIEGTEENNQYKERIYQKWQMKLDALS